MSILNSYKRSGFFSKNLHRGINGLQAFFTADKALSRQSDDLGKANANIQFVKELWNLAETGLPEKFISWMKPSIKYVTLSPKDLLLHVFTHEIFTTNLLAVTI